MPTLHNLLQYCMAQEVKIEFRTRGAAPGKVEMVAHKGSDQFSHSVTIDDFTLSPVESFTAFLARASAELTRLEASRQP
jgi:hypothetical protein